MSAESGYPFFTFCNANKVVSMTEVDFCEWVGWREFPYCKGNLTIKHNTQILARGI